MEAYSGLTFMAAVHAEVMSTVPRLADIRLVLSDVAHRAGQPVTDLASVPLYATVKEINTANFPGPIIEINYMSLYANNGPYTLRFSGRKVGEHEGDWEHLTVRCITSGELVAVYYGAHGHDQGKWVPAARVPRDKASGRIVSFVARSAHGSYPTASRWLRLFGFASDVTALGGPVWAPKTCIVVTRPREGVHTANDTPCTPSGQQELPVVDDRGTRVFAIARDTDSMPLVATGAPVEEVQAEAQFAPWLEWRLRWGTQHAPQQQRWFWDAEHPLGTNLILRWLMPCIRR